MQYFLLTDTTLKLDIFLKTLKNQTRFVSFCNRCLCRHSFFTLYFFVRLICAFRTQVKKLKMELKNNFCIEKTKFQTFNILNAQFPKKSLYV